MLRSRLVLAAVLACSPVAFAQSFEASVGGGSLTIPGSNKIIGTASTDPNSGNYTMKGGFRLVFRMTLNSWRFMGHEFGYAYNRTSIDAPSTTTIGTGGIGLPGQPTSPVSTTVPAQNISVPAHQ